MLSKVELERNYCLKNILKRVTLYQVRYYPGIYRDGLMRTIRSLRAGNWRTGRINKQVPTENKYTHNFISSPNVSFLCSHLWHTRQLSFRTTVMQAFSSR